MYECNVYHNDICSASTVEFMYANINYRKFNFLFIYNKLFLLFKWSKYWAVTYLGMRQGPDFSGHQSVC